MITNEITTDEYFGGCPECGQTDGYLNCERTHWFVCHQHRAKWCAGANLFSGWRDEDEAIWTKNAIGIWHYQNVEPIYPVRARPSGTLITICLASPPNHDLPSVTP